MIADRPKTSFALFSTRERPDLRRSATVTVTTPVNCTQIIGKIG